MICIMSTYTSQCMHKSVFSYKTNMIIINLFIYLIVSSFAQLLVVLLVSSSVSELDTTFTSGTSLGKGEREYYRTNAAI